MSQISPKTSPTTIETRKSSSGSKSIAKKMNSPGPLDSGSLLFAILPAQQDNLILHCAREIKQTNVQVFHLYANRVNLGQCVLDFLESFIALGPASRHHGNIHHEAAAQQDPVLQVLQLFLHFFNQALAVHGALEQRTQYG